MASDPKASTGFFVCNLPTAKLRSRMAEIRKLIEQSGKVVVRPDGVLFTFRNTDEIAHALVDFIRFEQQCCSAITYELRSEPPHTELVLRLRVAAALVAAVQRLYFSDETADKSRML